MVRLEGVVPVAAAQATVEGASFKYQRCSLTDNNYYTPVAYTVDSTGKTNSDDATGSAVKIGNPSSIPPTLGVDGPSVKETCVNLTGTAKGETALNVYTRIDGGVVPGDWVVLPSPSSLLPRLVSCLSACHFCLFSWLATTRLRASFLRLTVTWTLEFMALMPWWSI